MSADDSVAQLDAELELIAASLLPAEHLECSGATPRSILITSPASRFALHLDVTADYPARDAVTVHIKGSQGRDEAEGWKAWTDEVMQEWEPAETPLYTLMTNHLLPLLAPLEEDPPSPAAITASLPLVPHHVLLVSHHLISPTKRKNLVQLASTHKLVGFSKQGHPGIMYASGDRDALVEWLAEVKSWNWLALRVRLPIEPLPGELQESTRARGDWVELAKLGEAMEWLERKGLERILVDAGVGSRG